VKWRQGIPTPNVGCDWISWIGTLHFTRISKNVEDMTVEVILLWCSEKSRFLIDPTANGRTSALLDLS
jgi:hypothetical protein